MPSIKAFTQLCKRVNLSLIDNTLTVYAKTRLHQLNQNSLRLTQSNQRPAIAPMFSEKEHISAEMDSFFRLHRDELGVFRFAHREDVDHELFHQDGFNRDDPHCHAQFETTLTPEQLEDFLGKLERYSIISADERKNFMKTYYTSNNFPSDEFAKLIIQSNSTVKLPAMNKVESNKPALMGGTSGFFLPKQDTPKVSDQGTLQYR